MFSSRNLKRNFIKFTQQPFYGLKVLLKRTKAELFYRFNPQYAPPPEAVTLFLTHKCNLRCKMCGQWGDRGVTKQKDNVGTDMSFEDVKRIIDDISSFKPNITLFGGEPLLNRNIIEIIRYIKSKKMHCLMITNAFLLEKYAEKLADAGLDELNISLDGTKEVHDEIRGVEGLFERIFNGVKKVNELRKGKKPLINLQTTITKHNTDILDKMLEVSGDMDADSVTFHHLIYLSEDDVNETKVRFKSLSPEDWKGFVSLPEIEPEKLSEIIEKIKKDSKKHSFLVNVYPNLNNEEIDKYYSDNMWFPESYKGLCKSPWICAYVFPDGELKPCLNFDYSFGNLRETDFMGAWNGEKAAEFRKTLHEEGRFPVCRRCTEIFRY